MIQRTRVKTPIHKEIVTNPKPNKKVKLLNEFVGGNKLTNKLVNENNIVINMPVPVVKKKRKKVSEISDEAKKLYQEISLKLSRVSIQDLRKSKDSTLINDQ